MLTILREKNSALMLPHLCLWVSSSVTGDHYRVTTCQENLEMSENCQWFH